MTTDIDNYRLPLMNMTEMSKHFLGGQSSGLVNLIKYMVNWKAKLIIHTFYYLVETNGGSPAAKSIQSAHF